MQTTRREDEPGQTTMRLVSDREVVIERTFRAPPRIVFDAWTRPELVRRWWAPKSRGVTVVDCTADVRVGGAYRYVLAVHEMGEIAFSGTYAEVSPPHRLVYTQVFESAPGGSVEITVTFEDRGARTHLVSREVYSSAEARDAALSAGMESGMRETLNQLDELVATLD